MITTITSPRRNVNYSNNSSFSPRGSESKKKYRTKQGTRGVRRARSKKKAGLTDTGLFNLSTATLSHEEKVVLNHGLKFVPPRPLNKLETYMDFHKYVRKLNVQ